MSNLPVGDQKAVSISFMVIVLAVSPFTSLNHINGA
jgi:hypothetical protein